MKANISGTATGGVGGHHENAQPQSRFVAPTTAQSVFTAPVPVASTQFINQVRSGLLPAEAYRQIHQLATTLELTMSELAAILATTGRTFARHLGPSGEDKMTPLTKTQTERLLLLKQVALHGLAVFEDQGKFNRWLRRPLRLLQDQAPLQLLDTVTGFRLLDQLLGRMEYGIYS